MPTSSVLPGIKSVTRATLLSFAALLIGFSSLLNVMAVSAEDCTPPEPTSPGVHWPTGSDAGSFTYQCEGTYAGKWTNAYYVHDPTSNTKSPLYDLDYSYDCAAAKWTMTQYYYTPANGTYYPARVDAGPRPGVSTGCSAPAAATEAASAAANSGSGNAISNTGPNSNNNVNGSSNSNYGLNNNVNASVNNVLTGVATSGSAVVMDNTVAGSAGSGNSDNIANVVNLLQSSTNALSTDSNLVVFTKDIDGDVVGDLILDPNQLSSVQNAVSNTGPNSNNNINNTDGSNIDINNSVDASINNDINLISRSGDATVSGNTNAGDATTGNAKAVANITNVINSALTAGKSFIGTININGNLNGDILLPDNFVDQLIAANTPIVTINTTGAGSKNNVNKTANDNTTVNNTNDLGVTNNVSANANTGSADVTRNTNAGSATTGKASTSVTAFNLTGSKVIGKNALLVFVNNKGNWVGLIVNAPAGANAAALGGSIDTSGPNSDNNVNNSSNSNTAVDNNVRARINNDVNVNAVSGNARVDSNTNAGNARSGDADAAVNLLNIENSDLTLSGWLGILFINVFGTWNGSFGVNTAAGNPVPTASTANGSGSVANVPAAMKAFSFAAGGAGGNTYSLAAYTGAGVGSGQASNDSTVNTSSAVLAAATTQANSAADAAQNNARNSFNWVLVVASLSLFFIWLAGERAYETIAARRRA